MGRGGGRQKNKTRILQHFEAGRFFHNYHRIQAEHDATKQKWSLLCYPTSY